MKWPSSTFYFRFVKDGRLVGLLKKRGAMRDDGFGLSGALLSYDSIRSVTIRDGRFVIGFTPSADIPRMFYEFTSQGDYIVLDIEGISPDELKRRVDSMIWRSGADLEGGVICPECSAFIDLNGLPRTRYCFCPFCRSVFDRDLNLLTSGMHYRVCDKCDMFGHVAWQTEYWFYFFLLSNRWSWRRRFLCDSCASSLFRDMVLKNSLFLFGLPSAFLVKIRSWFGRTPAMKALPKANRLAAAGDYEKADRLFDKMLSKTGAHPGLLFNQALAHLNGDDSKGALDLLEASLEGCANYLPALELFKRLEQVVDGTID